MKIRAFDTIDKRYVPIESIGFDHLGEGRAITLTTGGKTWAIGRFTLEIWTGTTDVFLAEEVPTIVVSSPKKTATP